MYDFRDSLVGKGFALYAEGAEFNSPCQQVI